MRDNQKSDEWQPCAECRNPVYRVRREHWSSFAAAAELEKHLRDNLTKADIDRGRVEEEIEAWKFRHYWDTIEAQACRDPLRSVEKMFEEQIGRRERTAAR